MRRFWIRALGLALLGLMVGAAGAGVAKASAALEHACCERPASDAAAPDPSGCRGFLPLSCCQAAALPGSDAAFEPAAIGFLTIPCVEPERLASHAAFLASEAEALSASGLRTRLSVILQV